MPSAPSIPSRRARFRRPLNPGRLSPCLPSASRSSDTGPIGAVPTRSAALGERWASRGLNTLAPLCSTFSAFSRRRSPSLGHAAALIASLRATSDTGRAARAKLTAISRGREASSRCLRGPQAHAGALAVDPRRLSRPVCRQGRPSAERDPNRRHRIPRPDGSCAPANSSN
jgi:hypothetical protein